MATKFGDFMRKLEDEAHADGPATVAQLASFRARLRLGRKLVQARLRHHLSQTQVARRAQVDQRDVSKIERGTADPTLATLSAVAAAVGLEVCLGRRSRR